MSAGVTFGPGSVTLAQSLANGLFRQGGKLHSILTQIEAAFIAAAPRTVGAGYKLVEQAAARVGYGIGDPATHTWSAAGVLIPLADRTATFISSGGVITVTRGAQVVLHLVPPGQ